MQSGTPMGAWQYLLRKLLMLSNVTMSGLAVKHGFAQSTLSLTPLPDMTSVVNRADALA
jgi:hypothetical protein